MQDNYVDYDQTLRQSMKNIAKDAVSMKAYTDLHVAATQNGELSMKVKELMAVSIAIATRCEGCLTYHLRNALEEGATAKEVYEAADVAIMMGGGPAVVYAALLDEMLPQFQEALGNS